MTPQEAQDLIDEVTAETTIFDSVVTWINGVAASLEAATQNATDLAALKATVTSEIALMKANAARVAAAIPANVPPVG